MVTNYEAETKHFANTVRGAWLPNAKRNEYERARTTNKQGHHQTTCKEMKKEKEKKKGSHKLRSSSCGDPERHAFSTQTNAVISIKKTFEPSEIRSLLDLDDAKCEGVTYY